MDKNELRMRRRQQMMYKINKKYFKNGEFKALHEFYKKNEKILNDYEKQRPDQKLL